MVKDNDLISVRNRNNGSTGYVLPDRNLWRNFAPNEVKKVPFEELRQLQYQQGGDYVLKNLLVIESAEALEALNMNVEPEYNYTEDDIRNLLLKGTIDQLKDFLDFAPTGCIEICKTIAVNEEIPDMRKREVISLATGFNINNAINVNRAMAEEDETPKEEGKKERRAETPNGKQRRTSVPENTSASNAAAKPAPAIPNYKVVKK